MNLSTRAMLPVTLTHNGVVLTGTAVDVYYAVSGMGVSSERFREVEIICFGEEISSNDLSTLFRLATFATTRVAA